MFLDRTHSDRAARSDFFLVGANLAFADGPTVLLDLATGRHPSAGLESVGEVRPSVPSDYMLVADNAKQMAARWAVQIRETLREPGCSADTLAVDRADTRKVRALDAADF